MFTRKISQIIGGKRYNCETAAHLCGNDWWDGSNYERCGTNKHLMRTKKGAYFFLYMTQWSGDHDRLEVCGRLEAKEFYEECAARDCNYISYEEAFDCEVEDA